MKNVATYLAGASVPTRMRVKNRNKKTLEMLCQQSIIQQNTQISIMQLLLSYRVRVQWVRVRVLKIRHMIFIRQPYQQHIAAIYARQSDK